MKTSRILSILAAICLLPLVGVAQEVETVEISIVGTPGNVVVVDGEELTIPEGGTLVVNARSGASVSSASPIRVTLLSSGAVVQMGTNSSITLTSNSVRVNSGVAMVSQAASSSPIEVSTAPGATVRILGGAISSPIPPIVEHSQRQISDDQVTPPNVSNPTPTPTPVPTPPVGTPT